MVDKVRPNLLIRRYRLPPEIHRNWKLTEVRELDSPFRDNLKRLGISGILVDGKAAATILSDHQVSLNARLAAGFDLKAALIQTFISHQLGASFIVKKEGKESEAFLCLFAEHEYIKDLGKNNLFSRPIQPYLPITSEGVRPEVTAAERIIRTREAGILPGKAIGHAIIFDRKKILIPMRPIDKDAVEAEIMRLEGALQSVVSDLERVYNEKVKTGKMTKEDADQWLITEPLILEDCVDKVKLVYKRDKQAIEDAKIPIKPLVDFIEQEAFQNPHIYNAEYYLDRILQICGEHFRGMKHPVLSTKADEISLLGLEIVRKMTGHDPLVGLIEKIRDMKKDGHNVILVADYLGGLEVDRLKDVIDGIIVNKWEQESHGAIVSKGVIPGVVQPQTDFIEQNRLGIGSLKDGDVVIIDGDQGLIIVHPEKSTVSDWRDKISDALIVSHKTLDEATSLDNFTADGVPFSIHFNIEDVNELDEPNTEFILKASEKRQKGRGGVRIGLFRTEYLLAGGRVPQVDELADLFLKILDKTWGLTVRLPDVGFGTDKDFFGNGSGDREAAIEMNPDLGLRGVRLLGRDGDYTEASKNIMAAAAIVNAKLKSSKSPKTISVLVPMVTDTLDHDRVQSALEDVKRSLADGGPAFDATFPLIAMIEVPSAAILADHILKKFDGGSFGTNDLVQFTLAADRRNPDVSRIRDPLHPAVLRMIRLVADEKKKYPGKSLSVCGVHSGNPAVAFVYMLLGINELSINRTDYVALKNALTKINMKDHLELAEEVLNLANGQEVRQHLKEKLPLGILRLLGLLQE